MLSLLLKELMQKVEYYATQQQFPHVLKAHNDNLCTA